MRSIIVAIEIQHLGLKSQEGQAMVYEADFRPCRGTSYTGIRADVQTCRRANHPSSEYQYIVTCAEAQVLSKLWRISGLIIYKYQVHVRMYYISL